MRHSLRLSDQVKSTYIELVRERRMHQILQNNLVRYADTKSILYLVTK